MDTDTEHIIEAIDDEAAQGIAIRVDDAEGIGCLGELQVIEAEVDGSGDGCFEVLFGVGFFAVEEDAEGDAGFGVIEAGSEGLSGFVIDVDEVSGSGVGGGLPDHGGVDGGVVAKGLELDPWVAPGGFIDGCAGGR